MCYRVVEDLKGSNRTFHCSIVVLRFAGENAPQKFNRKPSDYYFPTPKDPNSSAEGRKRKASKLTKTTEGTDEALGELVRQAGEARGDSGTIGPVESSIREEYLQQCKENQERLIELTAPPDIETERSLLNRIISWKQVGKPGNRKVLFQVEGPDGGKPFFCNLDDLKVDAPITLAKFINDVKSTSRIGNADKTLVKWAQQMIKDHSKFIRLSRSLEERR